MPDASSHLLPDLGLSSTSAICWACRRRDGWLLQAFKASLAPAPCLRVHLTHSATSLAALVSMCQLGAHQSNHRCGQPTPLVHWLTSLMCQKHKAAFGVKQMTRVEHNPSPAPAACCPMLLGTTTLTQAPPALPEPWQHSSEHPCGSLGGACPAAS